MDRPAAAYSRSPTTVVMTHVATPSPQVALLRSKLRPPVLRSALVPRAPLLTRLREGRQRRLTLVCAPAGYGKTTLLAQWCAADHEETPFVWLFAESAGRVLVAVPRTEEPRFTEMCTARQLPWTKIGVVDTESDEVQIQDVATFSLAELRTAWEATLPALFATHDA